MELVNSGGTEPDCDSTSGVTTETIPTPDPTDEDAFLQLSQNSTQQTPRIPVADLLPVLPVQGVLWTWSLA